MLDAGEYLYIMGLSVAEKTERKPDHWFANPPEKPNMATRIYPADREEHILELCSDIGDCQRVIERNRAGLRKAIDFATDLAPHTSDLEQLIELAGSIKEEAAEIIKINAQLAILYATAE